MNGLINKENWSYREGVEREELQCDCSFLGYHWQWCYCLCLYFFCVSVFLVTVFGESLSATSEGAGSGWKAQRRPEHEGFNVCFGWISSGVVCPLSFKILAVVVCVLFWTGLTEVNINDTDSAFNSHFQWNGCRFLWFSVTAYVAICCPVVKHTCDFFCMYIYNNKTHFHAFTSRK